MSGAWIALLTVVACCSGSALAQAYPATYPLENEAIVPPMWIVEVPSRTFDDADPGGYCDYHAYKLAWHGGTLTEDDFPYTPWLNGFAQWLYVVQFEIAPLDDYDLFNCTASSDARYDESDFTGLVAGERVCEVGSCCKDQMGRSMFSDDTLDYESWFNDRVSGSRCDTPLEVVYCHYISGDTHSCCYEYFPSLNVRPVVFGCYDTQFLFNLNCDVFKLDYPVPYKKEPPQYYARLDVEQTISVDSMQNLQDRLCHPYSYFVPSSIADSSDSNPTSDSASDSASDSSTPSSSTSGSFAWVSLYAIVATALIL